MLNLGMAYKLPTVEILGNSDFFSIFARLGQEFI